MIASPWLNWPSVRLMEEDLWFPVTIADEEIICDEFPINHQA